MASTSSARVGESSPLPATESFEPATWNELVERMRQAYAESAAVFPVGGGTSLDYGMPASRPGWEIRLGQLDRVIDYPAGDMTVTVEAGITIEKLQGLLRHAGQELPIDFPLPHAATLGGAMATNFSGPRRYGHGTLRDYVLGVEAADGRGEVFHGGGRVVKNVAGYDFCKLLVGSLGTLGIIGRVTLKVRPLAEASALVACRPKDLDHLEQLLADLVTSAARPAAIEWLAGPEWSAMPAMDAWKPSLHQSSGLLVVRLEGTQRQVAWMVDQVEREWLARGAAGVERLEGTQADDAWNALCQFPAHQPAALVLKIAVVPSRLTELIERCQQLDQNASLQAHAGNGVLIVRFPKFPSGGMTGTVTQGLLPSVALAQGSLTVLSNPEGIEATRATTWCGTDLAHGLMRRIKDQFDPKNLLNPGRFLFP